MNVQMELLLKKLSLKLKSILRSYWPFLIVIAFDTLYLWEFSRLTGWASWDFPGHLYQSHSSLLNLEKSVYSFKYFLGYYPILYPPIGITLVSFLHSIFNFVDIFVVAISVIYISRIIFFFFLYKLFKLKQSDNYFYIIISTVFIVTSLTFNTVTIWEGGALSAYIAYAFLSVLTYYLYLYAEIKNLKSTLVIGLLLGLIILTHTITASVALLLLTIKFIYELLNRDLLGVKFCFYSILIGLLIGSIWLIPYIDLNDLMPKTGVGGYKYFGVYILNFVLLLILLNNFKRGYYKKIDYVLIATGVALIVLSMISAPFRIIRIHNSRYLYYGLIFIAPYILFTLEKSKIKINRLTSGVVSFLFLILLFGMILQRDYLTRLSPYNKLEYITNFDISGRVLDVSNLSGSTTFPHLVNTFLVKNNDQLVSTGGLFVENAPNGIYALALRASINGSSWFPLYNTYYKYYIKSTDIYEKAELLGVNNMVTSTGKLPDEFTDKIDQTDIMGRVSYFGYADYYLHRMIDTPQNKLVTRLKYHPRYIDTYDSPVELWNELNLDNIYTFDNRIEDYTAIDIPQDEIGVEDIMVSSNKLKFRVDSEVPIPVYIKFAYSKNLVAFDDNGNSVEILKVSPDFMLLYGAGNITVQNYVPFSYKYAWWITVVSLFGVIFGLLYLGIKDRK